jgi:hypothetical protein
MSQRILVALSLVVLGNSFALAATPPAGPMGSDGLVTLQASKLDEFSVRPNADLASYRKVIVDPAQVEFKKGWLRAINSTRDLSRWLTASDQQQIADTAAASLNTTIADAFKARGYEIVTTPGQGVLRVAPRVTELYVNAPDVPAAAPARLFNVDAGDATLALEARDSASGTLLARVVDRGTARELSSRINPAFAVTNQFWFDAMFRQWTAAWIGEFGPVTAAR